MRSIEFYEPEERGFSGATDDSDPAKEVTSGPIRSFLIDCGFDVDSVRVEEVDPKVTRVLVQCRTKGGGADLALASEIDKRIALRLASTR